ncbi:PTS sugar transporter subunit IIB [Aerococcus urinaeequi]|uniref:PTS sugar transporter subunit IIB n=1 Tax=Aerococcus urinaeequi TaxID=51665 RepID=UPI002890BBF5|nr:PTS sugar transporter subunit IIB [Aerococcus urinaeequi]MDT2762302.1 PTS sugar transporter subunit IIB [Aerococcus urinaeequi]
MKIITVCGLGVGTSLMLKMTVESAMQELGREADVEHWDMGTIKGKERDLVVTSEEFRDSFEGEEDVIFVQNIMSKEEVKEKLEEYFN